MSKLSSESDFESLIASEKPVLVDFFATWCGPCQVMLPVIEELEKEANNFAVAMVDIDELPQIAGKYNVMSVPALIIFKNGKEVDRTLGVTSKDALIKKLESASK